MTLPRFIYTTLLRLGSPLIMFHLARRARRQADAVDDRRQRWGHVAEDARSPVWLHGASAGEIQSLAPLAAALQQEYPLRMSAFTATGRARAAALLPGVEVDLSPLDLPGAWRRYLSRIRPRLAVIAETELWPNLLAVARERGLPVWLVSARMSEATERRLRRFPATARELMGSLQGVLAQSDSDLERFVRLGLPGEKGRVTGSLKRALLVPESVRDLGENLRRQYLPARPVWVAGSVRSGEENAIAEAVALVHERHPAATAIVVPRHPETSESFKGALRLAGENALPAEVLEGDEPLPPGATIVVDRVGVLLEMYAAGDAAFVGGTLAPIGGHNILEPALLGLPVLVGPSLENVRRDADRLKAAGALAFVRSGRELGEELAALFDDAGQRTGMGRAGAAVASDDAALKATLEALRTALGKSEPER